MLEFCLSIVRDSQRKAPEVSELCPRRPQETILFSPPGGGQVECQVFFSSTHPRDDIAQSCFVTPQGGLRFLRGYPISGTGRPVKNVADFDPTANYIGDFFYMSVDATARIEVVKSKVCSYQLYYSKSSSVDVISSRPSMCAKVLETVSGSKLENVSARFASEVCSYSVGLSTASMLPSVENILNCQTIFFIGNRINVSVPDYSFLIDQGLRDTYANNRQLYWDDTFEKLTAAAKVLDLSEERFLFPLSGGKDSRLLLGLLLASGQKDRISVYTDGPTDSPEVRSAKLVCEQFGLDHERRDPFEESKTNSFTLHDKLMGHLILSDGETSPKDLLVPSEAPLKVSLHGQEMGLRNISGKAPMGSRDDLHKWFRSHLSNGDKCKFLTTEAARATMENVYAFADGAIAAQNSIGDIPSLHRVIFRGGRWVSRIWRYYNDRQFAPFLLVEPELISATFNSGAQSRINEEFHFEMLRRVDKTLVEIPFAEQTWPEPLQKEKDIAMVAPLNWPAGKSLSASIPTHIAMYQNWPKIQQYVLDNIEYLPRGTFDALKLTQLKRNRIRVYDYQTLWQLVQVTLKAKCGNIGYEDLHTDAREFGLPTIEAMLTKSLPTSPGSKRKSRLSRTWRKIRGL